MTTLFRILALAATLSLTACGGGGGGGDTSGGEVTEGEVEVDIVSEDQAALEAEVAAEANDASADVDACVAECREANPDCMGDDCYDCENRCR